MPDKYCDDPRKICIGPDCARPMPAWVDNLPNVWAVIKQVWSLAAMILAPLLILASFFLLVRGDVQGAIWMLVAVCAIRLYGTEKYGGTQ